jgi:hypothetical protein
VDEHGALRRHMLVFVVGTMIRDDRILVSTRKGLFTIERQAPQKWDIARVSFRAQNVSLTSWDPRDGAWYAALDLGHFGAKLHRSTDTGATRSAFRWGPRWWWHARATAARASRSSARDCRNTTRTTKITAVPPALLLP